MLAKTPNDWDVLFGGADELKRVLRLAISIIKHERRLYSEAESLASQVIETIAKYLKRGYTLGDGLVKQVTRNLCIDEIRKQDRRRKRFILFSEIFNDVAESNAPIFEPVQDGPSVLDQIVSAEKENKILEILRPDEREAIILSIECTGEEAAEIMEIGLSSYKGILLRARRKLQPGNKQSNKKTIK